jgi:hypothetical protein
MGNPISKRLLAPPPVLHAALALVLTAGVGAGAHALAAGSKDPADAPATVAASGDPVRSILPPEAYDAMVEQMYEQISTGMQRAKGALSAEKQKGLRAAVTECLPYDDLLSWTAEIYRKHFSKKEIDDLAKFYRTPSGKKLARLMPMLTGEIGAKVAPLMMTRLHEALKKHGLE